MRIQWQVEAGGGNYKQSYTRRLPKKNILHLLNGMTWETYCTFSGEEVFALTDNGDEIIEKQEVRVLAGPNYNLPKKISEKHVLIINILWEDPIAKRKESKEKLKKIAEIAELNPGSSVKTCIIDLVNEIEDHSQKQDYYKIVDLIYMSGDIFEKVYDTRSNDSKMNMTTLIGQIYAIKNGNNKNDENSSKDDLEILLEQEINNNRIVTLF